MSNRAPGGFLTTSFGPSSTYTGLDQALGATAPGVWTLEEVAYYTANRTWPTYDPQFNTTTLLLHGGGTNGAQNNTFLDSSTNNFTITRNGNTTQGTFTPFSQTGWSNYFPANGNYVWTATPTNVISPKLNTQWTCEFFVFPIGSNSLMGISSGGSTYANIFTVSWIASGTSGYFRAGGNQGSIGAAFTVTSAVGYSPGQWYHIAVTKNSSNVWTLFINGTNVGTSTYDFGISTSAYYLILNGVYDNNGVGNNGTTSYLSNLRIIQSAVNYTNNFTPPTAPLTTTVSSGTVSLLTCQSNRFIDNSSNAIVLTVVGTPSVQAFSPFAPTSAYSASVVGGSGYFDGTGDYLSVADNAAFDISNGAFTLEAFVYLLANNSFGLIIGQWGGSGSKAFNLRQAGTTFYPEFSYSTNGSTEVNITGTSAIRLNQWNHIVAVRNSSNTLSLFLNGARVATDAAFTATIFNSSTNLLVGSEVAAQPTNGYIFGARLVKGSAVYDPTLTTLTIPTAPLTAVTNTSLLLNFTNAGIIDNTAKNNIETVGNAQISTTQSKFTGGSMAFDGTGDYLQLPNSPLLNLSSGDWTIEAWVYQSVNTANAVIVQKDGLFSLSYVSWKLACNNAGKFALSVGSGNGTTYIQELAATSFSNTTGVWYHIAGVKLGTTLTLYIDGVSQVSATQTGTIVDGGKVATVGYETGQSASHYWNGYITELRITKFARYLGNFTPPTARFQDQ